MSTEITRSDPAAIEAAADITGAVAAVVSRGAIVARVMKEMMVRDVDFGIIPGTPKPSLYKPGAEKLAMAFGIFIDTSAVVDLSDCEMVRYRVTARAIDGNGRLLGACVGECSDAESKYRWRKPVCQGEFDATPADQKRMKWKSDGKQDQQVRTDPDELRNTLIGMAAKRAMVAVVRRVTGASGQFSEGLEDLPPEVREAVSESRGEPRTVAMPRAKQAGSGTTAAPAPSPVASNGPTVMVLEVTEGPKACFAKLSTGMEVSWFRDQEALTVAMRQAEADGLPVSLVIDTKGKYNNVRAAEIVHPMEPGSDL